MFAELTIIKGSVLFSFFILFVSMVLILIRLILGPTLPDRVVALDMTGTAVMGLIACYTILTKQRTFLDPAVVLALIGFLGTVAFAKFIEKRGPR